MIPVHYFEGRLTSDPELRSTNSGRGVLNFTIANSDSKPDGNGGWEKTAEVFLDVVVWATKNDEHKALNLSHALAKGTLVVVKGKLNTQKWVTEAGENRSRLVVNAFDVYTIPTQGNSAPPASWGTGNQQQGENTGFNSEADEAPPF